MENDIQNTIIEYLRYKNIYVWRNNSIGVYDPVRKTFRKTSKWSISGVSDIIGIYKGIFLAIEVKREHPKTYPTKQQKEFIQQIENEGGIAFVARSIEDVKNNLNLVDKKNKTH